MVGIAHTALLPYVEPIGIIEISSSLSSLDMPEYVSGPPYVEEDFPQYVPRPPHADENSEHTVTTSLTLAHVSGDEIEEDLKMLEHFVYRGFKSLSF